MIEKHYDSLDDVAVKLVKDLMLKDPGTKNFDKIVGINGYVNDLLVQVASLDCSIDLGKYLYTRNKWSQLLKLYVDKDQLVEFSKVVEGSRSYSQVFYFKQKSHSVGNGNGSCLISMAIVRNDRGKKFSRAVLSYRTTVLTKQFVCDLLLLKKLAEFLNENSSACEIKTATIFSPISAINSFQLALYHKNYKLNVFKHPDDPFCKKAGIWIDDYFHGEKRTKFKSYDRLIRYYNSGELPSIPLETLSIF